MSFKHLQLVINHSKTKGSKKATMIVLGYRANDNGECWPSLTCIAKDAGLNRRTVSRCLPAILRTGELLIVRRGHVAQTRGGIQESNRYRITIESPQGRGRESLPLPDKVGAHSPQGRGGQSHKVGAYSPQGRGRLPHESSGNRQYEPSGNRQEPAGLPDHQIDYEKTEPPEVRDYSDIAGCPDPILAAMGVTGERNKQSWGYWVKVLNHGRNKHGPERAERIFKGCVTNLFGELKAGEVKNPGALLNKKLKDAFR